MARNKVGHVLQGRFKANLADGDAFFLEVCRYVERMQALAEPRNSTDEDIPKAQWRKVFQRNALRLLRPTGCGLTKALELVP